jgi:hypothetical protein
MGKGKAKKNSPVVAMARETGLSCERDAVSYVPPVLTLPG